MKISSPEKMYLIFAFRIYSRITNTTAVKVKEAYRTTNCDFRIDNLSKVHFCLGSERHENLLESFDPKKTNHQINEIFH